MSKDEERKRSDIYNGSQPQDLNKEMNMGELRESLSDNEN